MSVTSVRNTTIIYSGDVIGSITLSGENNAASPGSVTIHTLASGDNTITCPTGGSTVKGATIVPPAGNTVAITIKGITGDTGIVLSKTNPTSIGFETAPATFLLVAGGTITGLRIFWT